MFSKRHSVIVIALAACALGIGVTVTMRELFEGPPPLQPLPEPPAVPAGPAELAVVAPLVAGNKLVEGWTVREIRAVRDGTFRVACKQDDGRGHVDLEIALHEDADPSPPAVAGRFAIFYAARRVEPSEAAKLATALAKVIEKNKDAAPPPGLTAFHPKAKEPEPL